jgi:hypothetical protein
MAADVEDQGNRSGLRMYLMYLMICTRGARIAAIHMMSHRIFLKQNKDSTRAHRSRWNCFWPETKRWIFP